MTRINQVNVWVSAIAYHYFSKQLTEIDGVKESLSVFSMILIAMSNTEYN